MARISVTATVVTRLVLERVAARQSAQSRSSRAPLPLLGYNVAPPHPPHLLSFCAKRIPAQRPSRGRRTRERPEEPLALLPPTPAPSSETGSSSGIAPLAVTAVGVDPEAGPPPPKIDEIINDVLLFKGPSAAGAPASVAAPASAGRLRAVCARVGGSAATAGAETGSDCCGEVPSDGPVS